MRKLIVLLAIAVMILCWAGTASANTEAAINAAMDAINQLHAQGIESSADVNQAYVDISNSSIGTVTDVVYSGIAQTKAVNSLSVQSQVYGDAENKITQFVFLLENQYNQSDPNNEVVMSGIDILPMVCVWTYGPQKDQAMSSFVSGLADCLNNNSINGSSVSGPVTPSGSSGSGSSSWTQNYTPATAPTVITSFKIGDTTYAVGGVTQTMDVAPVIQDNRTFVPVRYLAESLGVPESGIQWDGETQQVAITETDPTTIVLTIGSITEMVNGAAQTMDAAPYILDGRTMLPARWIAEPLGATVTWDAKTQQTTISIPN